MGKTKLVKLRWDSCAAVTDDTGKPVSKGKVGEFTEERANLLERMDYGSKVKPIKPITKKVKPDDTD